MAVVALAVLSLVLTSCAGEDQIGSPSHRMMEWVNGTGLGQDVGALVADDARVPKVVPNGTGAVHAACAVLEEDAQAGNGELPTPDPQVTTWLSDAYELEGTVGTECYDAGASNHGLLTRAEHNAARAQGLFERALVRIQSIDGHPVSTTTTTDGASGGIFG
ncbi:MAG TPA: hypothetical protein VL961_00725 [Acidimicrobiales bacterium]|nr:hypothetical protein [Acidimicrobiales bacterium]